MPVSDNSQVTIKRNWLLGGSITEFTHSQNINPVELSKLTHNILRVIKAQLFKDNSHTTELTNIKGRQKADKLLTTLPPPVDEELLQIAGEIATSSERDQFNWEPFNFSCQTNFKGFEGVRSILYAPHLVRSAAVPEWYPWWLLGAGAPIKLGHLRVGLELFTSKFALTRLSFMPIVTETLLLDASDTTLSIKLLTEQPRAVPSNPFKSNPLLASISQAVASATNYSPSELFQQQVAPNTSAAR
jgi:hypothetical protein